MAAAAAASSSGGGGGGDGHGGAVVPLGKPLTAVLLSRSAALDVILLILFPSADAAGAFAVGEAAGAAAAAEVGHLDDHGAHHGASVGGFRAWLRLRGVSTPI